MSEKHKALITIDIAYGEVYLEMHENKTVNQAIADTRTKDNHVCFALTPKNALELAKELIDGAWIGKTNKESVAKAELETYEEKEK